MTALALHGATPVRTRPWPCWPQTTARTEQAALEVLRGGRWSVSGLETDGSPAYDIRFAQAFARYNQAAHCIPTANGTSALMCAMQALGIGEGDEVIVPGLTWVSCANSVLAINAVPVIVDVDPFSLCLDPEAVRAAIGPRTRAVMAVHLYNAIADLDRLLAVCQEAGIHLIEDCAQAHGARWRGKRVGTLGTVGTFSMQNGKVLTSGEGGACICQDARLAERLYLLRTDGRRLLKQPAAPGRMSLEEVGQVFAQNFCLSEIQAAVLLSRLEDLDAENARREENAQRLRHLLGEVGGLGFQRTAPGTDAATLYHFPVRLEGGVFERLDVERVAEALSAELGCWVHPTYAPLDRHPLLDHGDSRRLTHRPRVPAPLRQAEAAWRSHVVLPHWLFLDDASAMADIAEAFAKVARNASRLASPHARPLEEQRA